MKLFLLLLLFFGVLHLWPFATWPQLATPRNKGAVALGLVFVFSGVTHLLNPDFYMPMMPAWIPLHREVIYLTGFLEIVGGLGLLSKKTRRSAAFGLITLLVAVTPANVHVAITAQSAEGTLGFGELLEHWVRVPFHFVWIVWAVWCSKKDGGDTCHS